MDAVDALLVQVKSLSGREEKLEQMMGLIKAAEEVLQKNAARLSTLLNSLDPARQSLAILCFLEVLTTTSFVRDDPEAFITQASSFFLSCPPEQIRLAPAKPAVVSGQLKDLLVARQEHSRGILPLQAALRKVQPSAEHCTPQHADFLQLCLLARCYSAALPVLKDDIFEVDTRATGVTPRSFLLYCYYGGMVYVGLKRFSKALELFQHAITAPALALNAITVAIYKKRTLISLISSGQVAPFPKYTPTIVQRNMKACCQEYMSLVTAYNGQDTEELQRCVSTHEATFRADHNLGLTKQVVASLYKRNIQRLTQTYLTLSLADIAEAVKLPGPHEAELHVLRMIEDGDIFAVINQKDGMVSFEEDPEQYNNREMVDHINRSIQSTIWLSRKVAALDEEIACDRSYLSRVSTKDRHERYGDPDDFEALGP